MQLRMWVEREREVSMGLLHGPACLWVPVCISALSGSKHKHECMRVSSSMSVCLYNVCGWVCVCGCG
jgi:hypothetical protein